MRGYLKYSLSMLVLCCVLLDSALAGEDGEKRKPFRASLSGPSCHISHGRSKAGVGNWTTRSDVQKYPEAALKGVEKNVDKK